MKVTFAVVVLFLFSATVLAQEASTRTGLDRFTVGVAAKISTLGIGADVAVPVARKLNVRGGFDLFSYSRGLDRDGVHYSGNLRLRSADALLDVFPFGGGFHVSPGVLLYNGNELKGTASVPGGQTFTLGGSTWLSSPTDPIGGAGRLSFNKAAPMILFGLGNMVPRSARHVTVGLDLGVAFAGTPKVSLGFTGTACDPTGLACRNAATDPNFQSSVRSEQSKLQNDASPAKYYPIVQFKIGYKF
jgi:hypothetical protein